MKRCVHCLNFFDKLTNDHVFPKSWYPDSTPNTVQRWTVPSCKACNNRLGKIEKELLVILGMCIDPSKKEVSGLKDKALRSMGIKSDSHGEERKHRDALLKKVISKIQPYKEGMSYLPGLGPHKDYPINKQIAILGYGSELIDVSKKIIRGIEYWYDKRFVEPPYTLEVYFYDSKDILDVEVLFEKVGINTLEPAFSIQRGCSEDDKYTMIYKIRLWDTINLYASIIPLDKRVKND